MPMVYEIEEVECRMTDIEEIEKNEDENNRSVRGSIFNSPKDFLINPSRINDSQISMLSHHNLAKFDSQKRFQDCLRFDTDRNLDISMSSVCSTPRHQYMYAG